MALAWRCVCACVASTVYDKWGPRASVALQRWGVLFAHRGDRTRDLCLARMEPNHWARLLFVLDLGALGIMRWTVRKITELH